VKPRVGESWRSRTRNARWQPAPAPKLVRKLWPMPMVIRRTLGGFEWSTRPADRGRNRESGTYWSFEGLAAAQRVEIRGFDHGREIGAIYTGAGSDYCRTWITTTSVQRPLLAVPEWSSAGEAGAVYDEGRASLGRSRQATSRDEYRRKGADVRATAG